MYIKLVVYIHNVCIIIGDPVIKRGGEGRGGGGIPLTSLPLPHVCACHNPGTGFPSYIVVFFSCSVRGDYSFC